MGMDDAQRGAFEVVAQEVMPPDKQPIFLMCFFHVMKNVHKHAIKLGTRPRGSFTDTSTEFTTHGPRGKATRSVRSFRRT